MLNGLCLLVGHALGLVFFCSLLCALHELSILKSTDAAPPQELKQSMDLKNVSVS